jgi:hypothetical protein
MLLCTERIKLTDAYQRIDRKAYIGAKNFKGFAKTPGKLRSDPSWKHWVVDCGHDIMIDKPDELASILVGRAQAGVARLAGTFSCRS